MPLTITPKALSRRLSLTALLALLAPLAAQAQTSDWPARPVTWINPFAAGSAVDVVGRIVAQKMAANTGQGMNVDLPREQQRILNRQNIHDGTIEKTGSMSWGFVPLTNYQGTDPRAVLEPLSEHLADYEQLMIQYYGAGVQACYRGPRLYDTETTRQMVARTINWYKKYRSILNADMIQLRRADGRDWDGLIHVDPRSKQKALGMLYNPTKEKITRTIPVPLYYTGLTTNATLAIKDDMTTAKKYTLNRNHELMLTITIEPESYTWFTIQ